MKDLRSNFTTSHLSITTKVYNYSSMITQTKVWTTHLKSFSKSEVKFKEKNKLKETGKSHQKQLYERKPSLLSQEEG